MLARFVTLQQGGDKMCGFCCARNESRNNLHPVSQVTKGKAKKLYLRHIKFAGKILLYIAGLLMSAHAMVPHQHDTDISDAAHQQQHIEASTFLEHLQLLFHSDLGEDHLEHIVTDDSGTTDVEQSTVDYPDVLPGLVPTVVSSIPPSSNRASHPKRIAPPDGTTPYTSGTRGPPFLA